ncbi:ribonuclease H-like domain-containing protein [Tanacetum coccineum]
MLPTTSPLLASHVQLLVRDPSLKEASDLCMGLSKPRVLGFSALLVMLHESVFSIHRLQAFFTTDHYFPHKEILERAHMQNCNPCRTPVDTESKLGSDGDPVSDPTLYRSLAGALQYLTFTRPDLSYAVQQRILCYVRGTLDYGLQLYVSSTTQLTRSRNVRFTLLVLGAEAEYRVLLLLLQNWLEFP